MSNVVFANSNLQHIINTYSVAKRYPEKLICYKCKCSFSKVNSTPPFLTF